MGEGRLSFRRAERVLVVLIALHSIGIGIGLLFLTDFSTRFGGWSGVSPRFFPRQGGVFHFVAAAAYLVEYFRYRGVTILVTAKAIAVVFLVAMWAIEPGAWSVPFSAAADGMMGIVAYAVHRVAAREPVA